MIRLTTLVVATMLALAAGCSDNPPPSKLDASKVDPWLVEMPNDIAIRNAIVRQQTIYPYHFVVGGATLNDLGRSDAAVLAAHYKAYPGRLSIRRGDAPKELYDARVKEVLLVLSQCGVAMNRASIIDAPAGGDGITSERVLAIEAIDKPSQATVTPAYYPSPSAGETK